MKDAEPGLGGQIADFGGFQPEPQIGLVGGVAGHRLGVGEAGKGGAQPLVRRHRPNHSGVEFFGQVEDVILLDETHLQIQLGELQLAVGAQVFVAEAAGDLEVFFDARHHQQLLHLLRRLGQGVEAARLQAAGHQEIAGALRRALNQDGRLDFQKAARVQEVADVFDQPVAQDEVLLHRRAAQVEVAVAQPQTFVGAGVISDVERRRAGGVEDGHGGGLHFHLAGGHRRVGGAGRARLHLAPNLHHPLLPQLVGNAGRLPMQFRVADHLHHAGAVAQVDEDDAAVVAAAGHPPGQGYFRPGVAQTQRAAVGRTQH